MSSLPPSLVVDKLQDSDRHLYLYLDALLVSYALPIDRKQKLCCRKGFLCFGDARCQLTSATQSLLELETIVQRQFAVNS